jgi:uncharacterized protein with GYD domain
VSDTAVHIETGVHECRRTSHSSTTPNRASRRSTSCPRRLEKTRVAAEAAGAKLLAYYLTMGQYDGVVITEAPDDETVTKIALATAGRGNLRTETLRAFTEDEAVRIASEL